MQNQVWEQVLEFLNRLRCENVSRDTAVRIPEYEAVQEELDLLCRECEGIIEHFSDEDKKVFRGWMEKAEDMISLEGQKAYCQGYVDCILLLSGLGLFRQDISVEELMERMK